MALSVTTRIEDGFIILDLTGTLTLGPTLSSLREAAKQTFGGSGKLAGVILQVSGITATDSSGLGELTVLYSLAAKRNCPIRLTGVTPNLRRMLEMTRIDDLLPSSDSIAGAKSEMRQT